MTNVSVPVDAEGNPKIQITVAEKNTINIGNYSNVIIEASVTKFVEDINNEKSQLHDLHGEVASFLDDERSKVLSEIGQK